MTTPHLRLSMLTPAGATEKCPDRPRAVFPQGDTGDIYAQGLALEWLRATWSVSPTCPADTNKKAKAGSEHWSPHCPQDGAVGRPRARRRRRWF